MNNNHYALGALAMLIQDYILYDEVLSEKALIKRNINNPKFYEELGRSLYSEIYLKSEQSNNELDCIDDTRIDTDWIFSFIFNPKNRLDLNDIIEQIIYDWMKYTNK